MAATGNWMHRYIPFLILIASFVGCNPHPDNQEKITMCPAPVFNADSAFSYVKKQVGLGPRVPATEAHASCGDYLVAQFKRFGASVAEQKDSVTDYTGKRLPLRNIIASFHPEKTRRVMLCAHWDTRLFADQDDDRIREPIDGANDGASGVAVLLEIARGLSSEKPNIGVDMILFDVEDQGRPAFEPDASVTDHFYSLGSRYWARNKKNYVAQYGILLDMVGAENAIFTLEGNSMQYAENVLRKVWDTGNQLGYTDHFRYNMTRSVVDDHYYVNEIAGIPCIDIIEYDNTTVMKFGTYWHTHDDDIDIIDPNTLKAVGQTVLQVIYNE